MNLPLHTNNRTPEQTQQILLDVNGLILSSDDQIFSTDSLRQKEHLFEAFPLLDSIFSLLQGMSANDPALYFKAVSPTYPDLSGFFDFEFQRSSIDTDLHIHWSIHDFTSFYKRNRLHQQQTNESVLKSILHNPFK
jgi:hypothetical protein